MTATLREIAKLLAGEVRGAQVLALEPLHSRSDRSLAIKLIPGDKFIVHSFAGDGPIACRDYVRAALGLGPFRLQGESHERSPKRPHVQLRNDDDIRQRHALALWHEARDPHDTIVATYLRGRGLELPDAAVADVRRQKLSADARLAELELRRREGELVSREDRAGAGA
jgi:putative DNA primase/helicase